MKRGWKIGLTAIVVVFVGIQFIPVKRTNPPVQEEITTSPEVKKIISNACYDCHSNLTQWPWYSYVAPVSWLVVHDVSEGRHHLNFTEWNMYDQKKKDRKLDHIGEEVRDGDMPLWYYTIMHQNAKLSQVDVQMVEDWTKSQLQGRPSLQDESGGEEHEEQE